MSLMVTSGGGYGLFGGKLATAWLGSWWDLGINPGGCQRAEREQRPMDGQMIIIRTVIPR